jgi:hypothetical protein
LTKTTPTAAPTAALAFKRGDIVANSFGPTSTRGCPLACGSGLYPAAIVVQTDPLVVVSYEGDMLWSCIGKERAHLKVVGTATPNEAERAYRRFARDQKGGLL